MVEGWAHVILGASVATLGTAMLGIVGWAFNTNTEVNVQKQRVDDLKELINEKFDAANTRLGEKFDATNIRLDRIERALNGTVRHG